MANYGCRKVPHGARGKDCAAGYIVLVTGSRGGLVVGTDPHHLDAELDVGREQIAAGSRDTGGPTRPSSTDDHEAN